MRPDYRRDLRPANEYKPDCAYHPGTPAVATIKVDGVSRDVCQRCWQKLRTK
jgi:hypothetical protein